MLVDQGLCFSCTGPLDEIFQPNSIDVVFLFLQGPVVQSIISLTSLLVVKMLTTHIFFRKNISVCAIFNDQSFNDMLTNDIISFEQLGPDKHLL